MSTTGLPVLHMVHIVGAAMHAQSSDGVDRKVVEEMATILALSDERGIELHRDIYAAREQLEIRQAVAQRPKDTATARSLERIEKSLARVARVAERARQDADPHWRTALRVIAEAGELWAAKQQSLYLEELGFQPMPPIQPEYGPDFGADIVIGRWLAMAPIMLELVRQAQEQLRAGDGDPDQSEWPGAMEWLVGKRLPELYEKFSGSAFRVERNCIGEIVENDAVNFVTDALEAMQLGSISSYTVATHFGNHTRRIRAD